MVELVQALLEREVRKQMEEAEIASLPLRPENRHSTKPTSELVLNALKGNRRHRLFDQQGLETSRFHDPLREVARSVLELLSIDCSAYGLTEPMPGGVGRNATHAYSVLGLDSATRPGEI